MTKPVGHYIVKEKDHTMVAWFTGEAFYKAGSAVPYNCNHFDEISKTPINLQTTNTIKGTKWLS